MKFISLFIFLLLFKVFAITNSLASDEKCLNSNTVSNYIEDLNILLRSLGEIHPDYTIMIGKAEAANQIKKIRERILYSCDDVGFSKLIIPFIFNFGLSHLSISGHQANLDNVSPFSVVKLRDGYFLKYILLNKEAKLEIGDRIISINGISIDEIWQKMSIMTEHIPNGINNTEISRNFGNFMSLLYSTSKFIIKSSNYKGIVKISIVHSLSEIDYDKIKPNPKYSNIFDPYTEKGHNSVMTLSYYNEIPVLKIRSFHSANFKKLSRYEDLLVKRSRDLFPEAYNINSLGINDLSRYENMKKVYADFTLEYSTFFYNILSKVINETSNEVLILDLRSNRGGHAWIGNALLNMILPVSSYPDLLPFSFERASVQLKKYYEKNDHHRRQLYSTPEMIKYFKNLDVEKEKKWIIDKEKRVNYGGLKLFKKIYILVDETTLSTASVITGIAQEHDFVEVIGAIPTGDYGIVSIRPIPIKLPTSGMEVSIPSIVLTLFDDIDHFEMTSKKMKKIGIYPDYVIEPTYNDIKQKRDIVLEKSLILSGFKELHDNPKKIKHFNRITFEEMLETLEK